MRATAIPRPRSRGSPASRPEAERRGARARHPFPLWSPGALRRLAAAVRQADVVHIHDCLYLPSLVAYAAARLARRPVLVTQHIGMVPYRSRILRGLMSLAYRLLGRQVLRGASQVIFVSEVVRRYFSSFVRFRAAPALVPNGVDRALFHPVDEARRAALRSAPGGRAHAAPSFRRTLRGEEGPAAAPRARSADAGRAGFSPAGGRSIRSAGRCPRSRSSGTARAPGSRSSTRLPICSCYRVGARAFRSSCRRR